MEVSDKSKDNFIKKYNIDNYKELINENLTSMQEVKIVLHGITPDEGIEFKLENIESVNVKVEENYNKKNLIYIPYDNLSLFNIYNSSSSSDQTSFNIHKSFIDYLKKLVSNKDSNKDLNKDLNKDFNKKIFTEKLYNNIEPLSNNDKYNLSTDMYIYSKLFTDVTSNTKDIMTDIFLYPFFDTQKRDSKYTPYILSKNNPSFLYEKYKEYLYPKDITEPNDDYKGVVTFYNLYRILNLLIPLKTALKFKINSDNEGQKEVNFLTTSNIKINPKYQELNKISNTSLEFHFDINVEKIDDVDYIKFILNLNGDIQKKNIDFLPQMLDPTNNKYLSKNIYFTNNFELTENILNREVFKDARGNRIDKRLFFLNRDIMEFLINYLNKTKKKTTNEGNNFINNVNLLIKYFFRQSKDPKSKTLRYKNEGQLFYNGKEYYINKISNIDYFQSKPIQYETKVISFSDATLDIDYATFIENYKKNINVIVKKNSAELFKLNPDNEDLSNNLVYFKPFREQIFTTRGLEFNKDLYKNYTLNLNTTTTNSNSEEITTKVSNIPFKDVEIIINKSNEDNINNLINDIYYKGKKYKIASGPDTNAVKLINYKTETITLVDETKQTSKENMQPTSKTATKNIYKISLTLNVLDKSTGPITLGRKLFSGSCNENCKNIDKSIDTTFKPLLNGKTFTFFEDMFKGVKNRKETNFQEVFDKTFPKEKNQDEQKTAPTTTIAIKPVTGGKSKQNKNKRICYTRKNKKIKIKKNVIKSHKRKKRTHNRLYKLYKNKSNKSIRNISHKNIHKKKSKKTFHNNK